MSGFELPPVAIKNTWKKREGRKGGGERKRRDLRFVFYFFPLTLHNAKNPCSIPSPSISLVGFAAPHHPPHISFGGVPIPGMSQPGTPFTSHLPSPFLSCPLGSHQVEEIRSFPLGEDFPGPAARISSKPGLLPNFERAALTSGREVPLPNLTDEYQDDVRSFHGLK